MLKPRLFHKLSLLVFVPLAFEFIFVAVLQDLQHQAELQSIKMADSKELVYRLAEVSRKVYQFGATQFLSELPSEGSFSSSIASDFDRLRKLSANSAERSKSIERIRNMCLQASELVFQLNDKEANLLVKVYLRRKVRILLNQLVREIFFITNMESAAQQTAPLDENLGRQKVVRWLIVGLAASTVLAVALLVVLHRSFVSRLEQVVENTGRFARKEKLLPADAGGDEIAVLDNVFHDMVARINAAAESEQKVVEAKQKMMQMVAHDVRSPLTAMGILIDSLKDGKFGELSALARTKLSDAARELDRMVVLVSNFLESEKINSTGMSLQYNSISISAIVESSVNALAALSQDKGVAVQCSVSDGVIYVDGDRLVQVLINLLSNAVRFSEPGQTVSISAAIASGNAKFSVSDTGPGVSEKAREFLFQRFAYSSSKDGSSSGLGLALAKEIVELHGGSIGIDASQSIGSTFWFTVPCE